MPSAPPDWLPRATHAAEVLIVGAGPSGLATADALQRAGFRVTVFERGPIAGNIFRYPTFMKFFSTPELLELGGLPLITLQDKPTRAEYLYYLTRFVRERHLDVRIYHEVTGITRTGTQFTVRVRSTEGAETLWQSAAVVIATGAYAQPRLLGVPGEDLPKVTHYFTEVHPYVGADVLVVGGANSAAEVALQLYRAGARVTLSYRRSSFSGIKYWLQPDLENRIAAGEITGCLPSCVEAIHPREVVLRLGDDSLITIPNDFVLAMTGYEPDVDFLRQAGVEVDAETRRPRVNPETLESTVSGLYIVGVILAGNVSSEIFIENMRGHGEPIVADLLRQRGGSGQ